MRISFAQKMNKWFDWKVMDTKGKEAVKDLKATLVRFNVIEIWIMPNVMIRKNQSSFTWKGHLRMRYGKMPFTTCPLVEKIAVAMESSLAIRYRLKRIDHNGSMYIGNIHWKHCRLETSFAFGNINCILETYIGYWKHNLYIGNIRIRLET